MKLSDPPMVRPAPAEPPRKPLMEMLLDPRSIQWLLATGGGLFVFGLVLYLYTQGIFENKLVVAVCLGVANAAALVGGWAAIRRTRYQLAGRALALLACLVMPLNLWFYHAQGLVTLEGHLWVAGVVVCALYAASALVLRDWTFVPILVGGVAMTGLLLLADVGVFWEIARPCTFLVVLGLAAIHVERAFPDDESEFSRGRFGRAFFYSGHVVLAGGLLLLLGAQVAGKWLYEPFFASMYAKLQAVPSPIVAEPWGRLLALGLVTAGVYAYLYSDLVVRRIGVYLMLAAGTFVWAIVLGLELLQLHVGIDVVLATLAGTSLAVNLVAARFRDDKATRALPALGLALALVPVGFGVVLYARATNTMMADWQYEAGWSFVAAMAVTVVACRVGAHVYRNDSAVQGDTDTYFMATAVAEIVGAAALLRQLGLTTWAQQAWILMLIPIAHCVAAWLYRAKRWAAPVLTAGLVATFVMLGSSVLSPMSSGLAFQSGPMNLTLAAFFAEAMVFFALLAVLHGRAGGVYWAAVTGSAAVWQLLLYAGVEDFVYALAFSVGGLVLLVIARATSPSGVGRFTGTSAGFSCANGILSTAFVAAILIGLKTLLAGHSSFKAVGVCAAEAVIALAAAFIAKHDAWRRVYVVAAVAVGIVGLLTLEALSQLSVWQKAELFAAATGVLLLIAGHVGWYRERGETTDMVSFALGFGCVMVLVPLMIGLLWHRAKPTLSWPDEIGVLGLGLALLVSGIVLRIKSTTLTGLTMTTVFVLTLALWARGMLAEMKTAAVLITIGGGLVFGTGLVLAVFRDRLLELPGRVRNREGVFQVLGWR